jgi:prepilin-type N-terminal cleavage/methylation domain-containing protein
MNRRRQKRQAGFSLIELLITIVLAGLVFAALVPVFVQASQTAQGERVRNAARNLAQDRIEKIRFLGYADVTLANLQSSSFYGAMFGTNALASGTGGANRTYLVKYSVREYSLAGAEIPLGSASSGSGAYKKVSVTLSWGTDTNGDGIGDTGNPSPIRPVTLATIIYKQWSGPQITSLTIGLAYTPVESDFPSEAIFEQHSGEQWLHPATPASVPVTATILSDDMRFMVNPSDPTDRGYVKFTVTPQRGAALAPWTEYHAVGAPVSITYLHNWTWTTLPEGVYRIDATAFAYDLKQGNTYTISVRIERGAPAAPASLTATAGNNQVLLTWPASTAGDFAYYEVKRVRVSDGVTTWPQGPTANLQTSSYLDGTPLNGVAYTYSVYVVDQIGLSSAAISANATPVNIAGLAPAAPTTLRATGSGNTVSLTWVPPVSTPAAIVSYDIFRDGVLLKNTTTTSSTDVVGYSADHLYQVQSKTLAGVNSVYASLDVGQASLPLVGVSWARATTGVLPLTYTIRVTNLNVNGNPSVTLERKNASAGWDPVSPTGVTIAKPLSHDWLIQPAGTYRASWGVNKHSTEVTTAGPSGSTVNISMP